MILGKERTTEIWPDPIPFTDYSTLPKFPIETLPGPGREMVETAAEVIQVDAGLAGSIYLGVLSTCLSKKAEVNLVTHIEPLNLYLCSIAASGERKSSTMGVLTKPLYEYQEQSSNGGNIVYIVDDITTERLGDLMAENGERMSVISTEGGIFRVMAGLYTDRGTGNFDLYLKAHSGDPWSVHRIGRESRFMNSPALTMCLTVQPYVITELGRKREFKGKGLLARFLFSHNNPMAGYRGRHHKELPEELEREYAEHIKALMEIPLELQTLVLSSEAQNAWDEFYNDIEAAMRPGSPLEAIKDWGSKLSGAVARIAGLLHYAEYGENAANSPISVNIVNASVAIGTYYKEHALATFGIMREDPRIEAGKRVLEYITHHRPATFKGRDVLRHKYYFKTMPEVNSGLEVLIDRCYIRKMETQSTGTGRPEATSYEVNPKVIT